MTEIQNLPELFVIAPDDLFVVVDTDDTTPARPDGTSKKFSWLSLVTSAPAPFLPNTNRWFGPSPYAQSDGFHGLALDVLQVFPHEIPEAMSIDSIGFDLVSGAAASAVVRLGIYAPGDRERPGELISDAGTIDASTAGLKEHPCTIDVPAGIVWVGLALQGAAGPVVRANTVPRYLSNFNLSALMVPSPTVRVSPVAGALPTTIAFGDGSANTPAPYVGLHRAP